MVIKTILKRNKIFVRLVWWWRSLFYASPNRLNLIKTLQVNFGLLPFKQALKLPVFIYGKVTIYSLRGKAIINGPITKGMIKLGYNTDYFSASKKSAMLFIDGLIIFNGCFGASVDYSLYVLGTLELGNLSFIGNGTKIKCVHHIQIGDMLRMGFESQVFDTNFHYLRNAHTGKVYNKNAAVVIGSHCWIGNRTTIMKGTILPDYSIVAGNSLLNKDYANDVPQFPTFAGTPAKLIGAGNLRIYSVEEEMLIDSFFREHPEAKETESYVGIRDEKKIVNKYFMK